MRLSVASHAGFYQCREALAPFEPHVPWRADILRYRAECYDHVHDARLVEARTDSARFAQQEKAVLNPIAAPASPKQP